MASASAIATPRERPMKALTLIQPWAYAIAHLGKRIENRTWKPPASVIGQRIAIHAGKKFDHEAYEDLAYIAATSLGRMLPALDLEEGRFWTPNGEVVDEMVLGAVVAVARVTGFVTSDADADSPWYFGPIGWVLDEVTALAKPVPCMGRQGLWDLPVGVEPFVLEQLAQVTHG